MSALACEFALSSDHTIDPVWGNTMALAETNADGPDSFEESVNRTFKFYLELYIPRICRRIARAALTLPADELNDNFQHEIGGIIVEGSFILPLDEWIDSNPELPLIARVMNLLHWKALGSGLPETVGYGFIPAMLQSPELSIELERHGF